MCRSDDDKNSVAPPCQTEMVFGTSYCFAQVTITDDNELTNREAYINSRIDGILTNTYGLSPFSRFMARQWLQRISEPDERGTFKRLRQWWYRQLNHSSTTKTVDPSFSSWQRGCPELIPGLRSIPIWNTNDVPWIKTLEENYHVIKSELLHLKDDSTTTHHPHRDHLFQPYRQPSPSSPNGKPATNDTGSWNVLYLSLHSQLPDLLSTNRSRFPKTIALVENALSQNGATPYDHAFISCLSSGTRIEKHHGPTNKKLRCHLPLVVPPEGEAECQLRVGDEIVDVKEGRCILFDDSFEHEAWNIPRDDGRRSSAVGGGSRIVLVFDIWHVDFSKEEIKFLDFLQRNRLRRVGKEDDEGGFVDVINRARLLDVPKESLWG